MEMKTTYRSGWYVRSDYSDTLERFVAWCKREMFTGDSVIDEPGDVWFEFGLTRERAIERLLASVS